MRGETCRFYVKTSRGQRCALLSFEEWKLRRDRLLEYCNNGGRGCTILANYLKRSRRTR